MKGFLGATISRTNSTPAGTRSTPVAGEPVEFQRIFTPPKCGRPPCGRPPKCGRMENNMENIKYYPRLRELRVGVGMNQTEIADILGMQQNQYSRYERGERELPMHLFVKLAEHYNVSLDYMVGLSDEKTR